MLAEAQVLLFDIALAQNGHDVVVHCNLNAAAAEETAARVTAAGGRAWVLSADLGSDSGASELIARAVSSAGRIDVLVNNAAALWLGEAHEISTRELQSIFAVNCQAPYRLMAEAAKGKGHGGRMINISSDAAKLPRARVAAYAASKAALESLTPSFAEWLGRRGITVNAIAPGPVRTEMMEPWLRDRAIEERVSGSSAQGRVAVPGDIVPIVLFLARADSGWVNGQTIEATGGRVGAW